MSLLFLVKYNGKCRFERLNAFSFVCVSVDAFVTTTDDDHVGVHYQFIYFTCAKYCYTIGQETLHRCIVQLHHR